MLDSHAEVKEAQDKMPMEKVTPARQKELENKLKQLGLKPPGYIRGMMDNDMKDVDICFLE